MSIKMPPVLRPWITPSEPSATVPGLIVSGVWISTVNGTRTRGIEALFVLSQTSLYHFPTGQSGRTAALLDAHALDEIEIAGGIVTGGDEELDGVGISLVFLIIVIGATTLSGWGPGLWAALLGLGLFDFFFVPPYLTFIIGDLHNILALFVFLGVSVLIFDYPGFGRSAGTPDECHRAIRRA